MPLKCVGKQCYIRRKLTDFQPVKNILHMEIKPERAGEYFGPLNGMSARIETIIQKN